MFFKMHSKELIDLAKQKSAEGKSNNKNCRRTEVIESYSTVYDQQQLQSKEMQDWAQTSTREIRKLQNWSRNFASKKSQKTSFLSKTGKNLQHKGFQCNDKTPPQPKWP